MNEIKKLIQNYKQKNNLTQGKIYNIFVELEKFDEKKIKNLTEEDFIFIFLNIKNFFGKIIYKYTLSHKKEIIIYINFLKNVNILFVEKKYDVINEILSCLKISLESVHNLENIRNSCGIKLLLDIMKETSKENEKNLNTLILVIDCLCKIVMNNENKIYIYVIGGTSDIINLYKSKIIKSNKNLYIKISMLTLELMREKLNEILFIKMKGYKYILDTIQNYVEEEELMISFFNLFIFVMQEFEEDEDIIKFLKKNLENLLVSSKNEKNKNIKKIYIKSLFNILLTMFYNEKNIILFVKDNGILLYIKYLEKILNNCDQCKEYIEENIPIDFFDGLKIMFISIENRYDFFKNKGIEILIDLLYKIKDETDEKIIIIKTELITGLEILFVEEKINIEFSIKIENNEKIGIKYIEKIFCLINNEILIKNNIYKFKYFELLSSIVYNITNQILFYENKYFEKIIINTLKNEKIYKNENLFISVLDICINCFICIEILNYYKENKIYIILINIIKNNSNYCNNIIILEKLIEFLNIFLQNLLFSSSSEDIFIEFEDEIINFFLTKILKNILFIQDNNNNIINTQILDLFLLITENEKNIETILKYEGEKIFISIVKKNMFIEIDDYNNIKLLVMLLKFSHKNYKIIKDIEENNHIDIILKYFDNDCFYKKNQELYISNSFWCLGHYITILKDKKKILNCKGLEKFLNEFLKNLNTYLSIENYVEIIDNIFFFLEILSFIQYNPNVNNNNINDFISTEIENERKKIFLQFFIKCLSILTIASETTTISMEVSALNIMPTVTTKRKNLNSKKKHSFKIGKKKISLLLISTLQNIFSKINYDVIKFFDIKDIEEILNLLIKQDYLIIKNKKIFISTLVIIYYIILILKKFKNFKKINLIQQINMKIIFDLFLKYNCKKKRIYSSNILIYFLKISIELCNVKEYKDHFLKNDGINIFFNYFGNYEFYSNKELLLYFLKFSLIFNENKRIQDLILNLNNNFFLKAISFIYEYKKSLPNKKEKTLTFKKNIQNENKIDIITGELIKLKNYNIILDYFLVFISLSNVNNIFKNEIKNTIMKFNNEKKNSKKFLNIILKLLNLENTLKKKKCQNRLLMFLTLFIFDFDFFLIKSNENNKKSNENKLKEINIFLKFLKNLKYNNNVWIYTKIFEFFNFFFINNNIKDSLNLYINLEKKILKTFLNILYINNNNILIKNDYLFNLMFEILNLFNLKNTEKFPVNYFIYFILYILENHSVLNLTKNKYKTFFNYIKLKLNLNLNFINFELNSIKTKNKKKKLLNININLNLNNILSNKYFNKYIYQYINIFLILTKNYKINLKNKEINIEYVDILKKNINLFLNFYEKKQYKQFIIFLNFILKILKSSSSSSRQSTFMIKKYFIEENILINYFINILNKNDTKEIFYKNIINLKLIKIFYFILKKINIKINIFLKKVKLDVFVFLLKKNIKSLTLNTKKNKKETQETQVEIQKNSNISLKIEKKEVKKYYKIKKIIYILNIFYIINIKINEKKQNVNNDYYSIEKIKLYYKELNIYVLNFLFFILKKKIKYIKIKYILDILKFLKILYKENDDNFIDLINIEKIKIIYNFLYKQIKENNIKKKNFFKNNKKYFTILDKHFNK